MDLKDKGVFLTGGAEGIGRAVIEGLLNRGAKVLFADINETKGQATEEELRKQYPSSDVIFKRCDVTNKEQLTEAFQAAVTRYGAVDICFNNAGVMDEENWERTIAINQVAQMQGSMIALEHMRKDKGGRGGIIINTGSVNSFFYGVWEFPVYVGTKHAMAGFTTSWANNPDNEVHGVRWGVVCPHACSTSLNVWDREHQTYLKAEDRKHRDTSFWMTAKEASYAFFTLLDDPESNGGLMKNYKQDGHLYQELFMMDRSTYPVTSLYVKYSKVQPADE